MQNVLSWLWPDRTKDIRVVVTEVDTPEYTYWHAAIEIDYARIVQVFHTPTINGDDDKRDATWKMTTPYGEAEMYNFKSGRNYFGPIGPDIQQIPAWHLRCPNTDAMSWILDRLSQTRTN